MKNREVLSGGERDVAGASRRLAPEEWRRGIDVDCAKLAENVARELKELEAKKLE